MGHNKPQDQEWAPPCDALGCLDRAARRLTVEVPAQAPPTNLMAYRPVVLCEGHAAVLTLGVCQQVIAVVGVSVVEDVPVGPLSTGWTA